MTLKVYLSGEIHTDWRERIIEGSKGLDVTFTSPVTDHAASDDCGVAILGAEPNKFWHDHKGAKVNAIRTRHGIETADIVVVRFGEKYKQWNAAFRRGLCGGAGQARDRAVHAGPSARAERGARGGACRGGGTRTGRRYPALHA
jgi:YtoQ family protein